MVKLLINICVIIGVATAGLVAFQHEIAGAFVEQLYPTPELLKNASEDDPHTAVEFNEMFSDGSDETALLDWLTSEGFDIRQGEVSSSATLAIQDRKCGKEFKVSWSLDEDGQVSDARAYARDALCF